MIRDILLRLALHPEPLRVLLARRLLDRFGALPVAVQVAHGLGPRPHYAYCILNAARLARRLGVPRIAVAEFGVAGGNGLVAAEHIAAAVERETGVGVEIYGFDAGTGLPPPADFRDLPYIWRESQFRMDRDALEARLSRARLVIGDVAETCSRFFADHAPAPLGAILFDLDYYSSTRDAFGVLDGPPETRLPRIFCYFDDLHSSDLGHVGKTVGVPLAIAEFNERHTRRHFTRLDHLAFEHGRMRSWQAKIYSFQDFDHPAFDTYIEADDRQLPLG